MISVSTNVKDFWDSTDEQEVRLLYGAGFAAEQIVALSKRANYRLDGFLDRDISKHSHYYNGLIIYSPNDVKEKFKDKNIKIFITINDIFGAIRYIEKNLDNVSVYMGPYEYDLCSLNFGIVPLRNKLVKNKDFTIIANTCAGVRTYQLLGLEYQSPFVGIIIKPDEYLKLLQNLEKYLSYKLEFLRYEEWKFPSSYHTLCKLGDIEIKFIGRQDFEKVNNDWNNRVNRINWNNMFIYYENTHFKPSLDFYNKFLEIPYGTKLIMQRNCYLPVPHSINTPDHINIYDMNHLVELWFDLISFINREKEY